MSAIDEFMKKVKDSVAELFENVEAGQHSLECDIDHLGLLDVTANLTIVFEIGTKEEEDDPALVLHFHTTIAANVPEESIGNLLISLNGLNFAISSGAYPSFGVFVYLPSLRQVYLSYRLPINPENMEDGISNVRFYLAILYDQLDSFVDFIFYELENPGTLSVGEYLTYLEETADIEDIDKRLEIFEKTIADAKKG